jgi:dolichol-phosphate mannosyltransferase
LKPPETTAPSAPLASLAVVMPVYNEALNLEAILSEWMPVLQAATPHLRFLAVNDGSRDNSAGILANLQNLYGDRLVAYNRSNTGHGRSCRFGYEQAMELGTEWILQIDSDGQCDPRYFESFQENAESYDCIFGRRTIREDGWMRKVISVGCRLATLAATGADLTDPNVPYRMMRRQAVREALAKVSPEMDMQNVGLSLALKRDRRLRWKYVPMVFRARRAGENSIHLAKILKMGAALMGDLKKIA